MNVRAAGSLQSRKIYRLLSFAAFAAPSHYFSNLYCVSDDIIACATAHIDQPLGNNLSMAMNYSRANLICYASTFHHHHFRTHAHPSVSFASNGDAAVVNASFTTPLSLSDTYVRHQYWKITHKRHTINYEWMYNQSKSVKWFSTVSL